MEEISVQEAAGSPRVRFQSLETPSEGLSPEPQFLQDTDMEQGLTGGKAERAPTVQENGEWRGASGPGRREARDSDKKTVPQREVWKGGARVPQFSPGLGPLC